jgi:hypothetical protein
MKWWNKGQSIVELIVALGVAAIFLPGLATGLVASQSGKVQQQQRADALALMREGTEAVRMVREKGWSTFASDGTYHPVLTNGVWSLQSGSESIRGFTRQIAISDVYRDSAGNISQLGGSLDPSTKKVVTTVSWGLPYLSSASSTSYLTRWLWNQSYTETTQPTFTTGTQDGVAVVATSPTGVPNDGQIQLGSGGYGNWCQPVLNTTTLDIPGNGIPTGITAIPGHAYITTGVNASSFPMDGVLISNPDPPTTPVAMLDPNGPYNDGNKEYNLFADYANKYVYITSDHPGDTVEIVSIAGQYSKVGNYSGPRGSQTSSIYVAYNQSYGHDVGYVTTGSQLNTFDLTSVTGSRPGLGSVVLDGTAGRVIVNGNYAYVAIQGASKQLDIVDITDPRNPKKINSVYLNGQPATDVYINQTATRAYVVTVQSGSQDDVFVLDITNKTSIPTPLGAYNTGSMSPTGVTVQPGNILIVVGSGGQQYQVITIANESKPVSCGGLTNPNGATSILAVGSIIEDDGDVYSYILTNSSGKEFQIIAGGPGGQYSASGSFESTAFDAGYDTAFNYFSYNADVPAQTSLKFQFALTGAVSNSCSNATYTFVGPDKTADTYFTAPSKIPFGAAAGYTNPGRCFKYKAFFSTNDNTATPVLKDVTVNYSP